MGRIVFTVILVLLAIVCGVFIILTAPKKEMLIPVPVKKIAPGRAPAKRLPDYIIYEGKG